MYQSDRGSYRKQESLARQFSHSCLGQIVITAAITAVILLLAYITRPSSAKMEADIRDDIRQCIEERDSLNNDWIDDIVSNAGYIFTTADSLSEDDEMMNAFNKYNYLRYYYHPFFATVYLHNNLLPEGKRCGLGIFGVVIPMLNYNDLLLNDELMRADTLNQRLIDVNIEGEYLGENPGLAPYRFRGE